MQDNTELRLQLTALYYMLSGIKEALDELGKDEKAVHEWREQIRERSDQMGTTQIIPCSGEYTFDAGQVMVFYGASTITYEAATAGDTPKEDVQGIFDVGLFQHGPFRNADKLKFMGAIGMVLMNMVNDLLHEEE